VSDISVGIQWSRPRERLTGHGENAGHLQRGRGVDLLDPGVGEGAADDVHVEHPRQHDVVHVFSLAADEAGILLRFIECPIPPISGLVRGVLDMCLLTEASRPRTARLTMFT
jgi:hypothetical protein